MGGPVIERIRQVRENIQDRREERRGERADRRHHGGAYDDTRFAHGNDRTNYLAQCGQEQREQRAPALRQGLDITQRTPADPKAFAAEFQFSVRRGAPIQYNYQRFNQQGNSITPAHPQRMEGNDTAVNDSTVARFVRSPDPRDPKGREIITVQSLKSFRGELTLSVDGRSTTLNVQNGKENSHPAPAQPVPGKIEPSVVPAKPPLAPTPQAAPAAATAQVTPAAATYELRQGLARELKDTGHTIKLEIGGKSVVIKPGDAETTVDGVTITRKDDRFSITVAPGHSGGGFSMTSQSTGTKLDFRIPDGTSIPAGGIPLNSLHREFPLPVARADALRFTDAAGKVILDVAPDGSASGNGISVHRNAAVGVSRIVVDPTVAPPGSYGVFAFRGSKLHSSGTMSIAP